MSVTIPIQNIQLTPGSHITIPNLSWEDFEQILVDLGEKRSSRTNQGYTETMDSPTFPDFPLTELIPQLVQKAINEGTSRMLRDFRQQYFPA